MKSRYVILDANVVIEAHKFGFWKALVTQYKISVTETILNEIKFYVDDHGFSIDIDLKAAVADGLIGVLEASLEELNAVGAKLNVEYAKGVDAGEFEAIAIFYSGRLGEDYLFCTADAVALKTMSVLDIGCYAVPVSKLLISIGYKGSIPSQYSEAYFKDKLAKGIIEKGIALRK